MHGHRGAAQGAADHDLQARHRRHQRLFEKAELAVPEQAKPGKDRREQHRHADHAGRNELKVVAVAGAFEDRPQTEARAPADTASAGRATRRSARASACSASVRAARECRLHSSFASTPHLCELPHLVGRVRAFVANGRAGQLQECIFQRSRVPVCSLISCGVPCATSLPWSMTPMRCATRSASSM